METALHKKQLWLRVVALVTAVMFTTQSTVLAGDPGIARPQPTPLAPSAGADIQTPDLLRTLDIPEAFGQIKKKSRGTNGKLVLCIQDAHGSFEAQRNIARILEHLTRRYGLRLINVEGASGELYRELYQIYPDREVRRSVSEYFMARGRLGAAEYFSMVERSSATLFGIEDADLYERNRAAYLDALRVKQQGNRFLSAFTKTLENVSRFVFSDTMREWVKLRSQTQEDGRHLLAYVRFLVKTARGLGVDVYDYTSLRSLLELLDLEKEIDFERSDSELEALLEAMKRELGGDRLPLFMARSGAFKAKTLKRS
ncbi:MAG: hypothetical protein WC352_01860 [Candidatus Omnitrophota bacterium]|jgi:hypothetical protein